MAAAADPPTCSNCVYFILLVSTDQVGKGLCRYDSPRYSNNRVEAVTDDGRWPLCLTQEWCGHWTKRA